MKHTFLIILTALLPMLHAADGHGNELFRDSTQPVETRVADLLSRLTLEEKALLLDHKGPTLERFDIRSDQWNQCLNGVMWDRPTTLFPTCIALAATWDTRLVHAVATVLSDEARAIYNGWRLDPRAPGEHKGLIYRAPVINIARNPYWGRNHEAWGEDPHLTGSMAVAYVRGLQGIKDHAGAAIEVVHDRGCDVVGVGRVATKIDNEEGFSSGASVKLDAQALGEFIEFAVPVPETGEYELKLEYKSFPSRGVYQLSIDGAPQGQPVDMYEAKERYGRSVSLGTRLLDAGKRTVRFTLNGKNAASGGFSGHFDKLMLVGKHAHAFECESLPAATGGPGERGSLARAAELARGADVAVVCIGTDARVEHESRDRQQLGLPGAQEELVKAVLAANPRTIVVQMSAGPLTVPWSKEHVPAMLQAWWSGEEGGRALAEVEGHFWNVQTGMAFDGVRRPHGPARLLGLRLRATRHPLPPFQEE